MKVETDAMQSEARTKAAAWAWYQRSGGGFAPVTGKPEAFAVRCRSRRTPSRFMAEAMAQRLLETQQQDEEAAQEEAHDRRDEAAQELTAASSAADVNGDDHHQVMDTTSPGNPCLDLVSLDRMACWDCGSSLFDSFELVSMSEKLDAKLDDALVKQLLFDQADNDASSFFSPSSTSSSSSSSSSFFSSDLMSADGDADENDGENAEEDHGAHIQENHGMHLDMPQGPDLSLVQPPNRSRLILSPTTRSIEQQLLDNVVPLLDPCFPLQDPHRSPPAPSAEKLSKQAIYDMFCQYGSPSENKPHPAYLKKENCESCGAVATTADEDPSLHSKKHRSKHRVSFHSLSKPFRHIAHLAHSAGRQKSEHHHHHHYLSHLLQQLHHDSAGAANKAGTMASAQIVNSLPSAPQQPATGAANPSNQDHTIERDMVVAADGKGSINGVHHHHHQYKHVHHHHHHHYHYLFHSEDGFRFGQSLDKSLMVAAAGLRKPKIGSLAGGFLSLASNNGTKTADYKRTWNVDLTSVINPASFSPNFQP